jgi:hypothetical protein
MVRSECTIAYSNMHGRGHIREYTLAIRFSFSETYPNPLLGVPPASGSPCKKLHDIAQISLMHLPGGLKAQHRSSVARITTGDHQGERR